MNIMLMANGKILVDIIVSKSTVLFEVYYTGIGFMITNDKSFLIIGKRKKGYKYYEL